MLQGDTDSKMVNNSNVYFLIPERIQIKNLEEISAKTAN